MSSRRNLFALFLAGVLLGGLVFLPAGLAGVLLESLAPGRVRLEGAEGTLWRGQARVGLTGAGGQAVSLGDIRWCWRVSRLLLGEVALDLQQTWEGKPGHATLRLSSGGRHVREVDWHGPASMLRDFSPAWSALSPEGVLTVNTAEWALGQGREGQEATLIWQPARLLGVEAGAYRLAVRSEPGGQVVGVLTTLSGDLRAEGPVRWSAEKGLSFQSRLSLRPGGENGPALPLFRTLCAGVRQECEFNLP